MSMPTPPGAASQSSSTTPSASKPPTGLSPGEAGVPGCTGETTWPLTRTEAIRHYNAYISRQLTTLHEQEDGTHYFEPLPDTELTRILTKLPNEGKGLEITQYDQEMSVFIMQQLNECIQSPTAFMYEVQSEGRRLILDVDGNRVPFERKVYDPSNAKLLYRFLPTKMIAQVGNYYNCLRQRPHKQGNTLTSFEYIPNKTYTYRDVKRTLAQIKIQVLPTRMWSEASLSVLTDQMLHPYMEWCPGLTLDFYTM